MLASSTMVLIVARRPDGPIVQGTQVSMLSSDGAALTFYIMSWTVRKSFLVLK